MEDVSSRLDPNCSIFVNPHAGSPVKPSQLAEDPDYLKLILTAQVYTVAIESPLLKAFNLSNRMNNTIFMKREDLQPVFSFKLRGAYNCMSQLSAGDRLKGVIACSAGS